MFQEFRYTIRPSFNFTLLSSLQKAGLLGKWKANIFSFLHPCKANVLIT